MRDMEQWMLEALARGRKALGPCHPNPAVGALVVHRGAVVASGFTQPPGSAHAEVMALQDLAATGIVPDASTTLVVTLEPCSTQGRTPPCTDAIIASGVRRVVIGATDANPVHAGRGFDRLRDAGIEVVAGVLAAECEDLNLVFNHFMKTGRPLVAGKIATTIDGRMATREGHSKWITGPDARADVAGWRRAFPAIAVGGGTVVADDPRLTSRVVGEPDWCPRRLIFDRAGRCVECPQRAVFADVHAEQTIYVSAPEILERVPPQWRAAGVEFWSWTDWDSVLRQCAVAGLTGVFVEGGAGLFSDLLKVRRLDYLFAYRAPKFLADEAAPGPFVVGASTTLEAAFSLETVRHATFGHDQLLRGFIHYGS